MAWITGTAGNDSLTGTSDDDNIEGLEGDDIIAGGNGMDDVSGGDGDDVIYASVWGWGYYIGGAGADSLIVDFGSAVEPIVGARWLIHGDWTEESYGAHGGLRASFFEIERLTLTTGGFDDSIEMGATDDTLYLNGGNDRVDSGAGQDVIDAGAGNDLIFASAGDDRIDGGLGIDTLSFASAGAGVTFSLADLGAQQTGGAGGETVANVERVIGGRFDDRLSGDDGDNWLNGGPGADVLTGGAGADRFLFDSYRWEGIDTVVDFEAGVDKITLLPGGPFAPPYFYGFGAHSFRIGSEAQDPDDRVIYDPVTGALLFDPDGTAEMPVQQFAWLSPGLPLTVDDLVIGFNRSPEPLDSSIELAEDSVYTFTVADFGFTDAEGDALDGIIVTHPPWRGSLQFDPDGADGPLAGIDVIDLTSGGELSLGEGFSFPISVADIDAGRLVYVPPADAFSSDFEYLRFDVRDAEGGISSWPATMMISVTPVSDLPSGADRTIVAVEDQPRIIRPWEFGFSDPDRESMARVEIDAVTGGTLYFDDGSGRGAVAVTGFPASFAAADIFAGRLSFVALPDAYGAGLGSITFRVADLESTDPTANVITVDVTPANDAPSVSFAGGTEAVASGDEFRINSVTDGDQWRGDLLALAGGGFVATWISGSQAYGTDIIPTGYAQIYDAAGAVAGEAMPVGTDGRRIGVEGGGHVGLIALDGGGFVAFHSDYEDGARDIFAQLYDEALSPVGDPFPVNSDTAGDQAWPIGVGLEGGGFVIAWEAPDGGNNGIFAQRFDADGDPADDPFLVNPPTYGQLMAETIALPGGGFLVSWVTAQPSALGGGDIFAQRFDASGDKVGAEFKVNSFITGTQWNQSMAVLEDGSLIFVWDGPGADGERGIFGRRFDADGNALGPDFRISAINGAFQQVPHVAGLAGGGFVVTWDTNTSGDLTTDHIIAQYFDADGNRAGPEFQVSASTPGGQNAPRVQALPDGRFVVAWTSHDHDGDGSGVYGRIFEPEFRATEQTALNLKGAIAVGDDDAGSAPMTVTLSVDHGRLDLLAGTSGAGLAGNGTGTVTITGTLAQIQALLDSDPTSAVSYTADGDAPPATAELTVTVDDGVAPPVAAIETIRIQAVNDGPTLAFAGGAIDEHSPEGSIVGAASASDPDSASLAFSLDDDAGGRFAIDAVTGAIEVADQAALDFESDSSHQITIRVSDGSGGFATSVRTISLNDAAEVLTGGAGADDLNALTDEDWSLAGVGGDDSLGGRTGDDRLDGGAGSDEMRGGFGDDLYIVDNAGDEVVELSDRGTDTLRASASYSLPDHVEQLVLTGGGNHHGTGNSLANAITGNGGNNRLDGRGGADIMAGGSGHDVYVVNHAGDQVIEGGSSGTDSVESSVGYSLPVHFEKLILTGNFGYDGRGNAGANTITGNAGGNFLNGGSGNDVIDGGAGNDQLMGHRGTDSLKGGAGDDRFYFNVAPGGANADDILDFSAADDAIYLLRSVFTGTGPNGTLAASAFHPGSAAADANDRILYDAATGNIFYDADGTGAAAAMLFATVAAGMPLTHADFVIYG